MSSLCVLAHFNFYLYCIFFSKINDDDDDDDDSNDDDDVQNIIIINSF